MRFPGNGYVIFIVGVADDLARALGWLWQLKVA
jgi:hypothetical protein